MICGSLVVLKKKLLVLDNWIKLRVEQWEVLTHWGPVTHICVGNLTIISPDNGLLPGRHQVIIWTNAGILLIGPWGTNFGEILIYIDTFSFKKMHLKMSSAKWRPFCLGLNVLMAMTNLQFFLPMRTQIFVFDDETNSTQIYGEQKTEMLFWYGFLTRHSRTTSANGGALGWKQNIHNNATKCIKETILLKLIKVKIYVYQAMLFIYRWVSARKT